MQNPFISYKRQELPSKSNSILKKKQEFRCEIRKSKISEIKRTMRKIIQFKHEENYNELKSINLTQQLKIILLMQTQKINQLNEREQNLKYSSIYFIGQIEFQKAIQKIFTYAVSTEMNHLNGLISESHLQKLVLALNLTYLRKKQSKYWALFNKILWILSNYTSYDPNHMPISFIYHIYQFLKQQRCSKQIIQLCLNTLTNMIQVEQIKSFLIQFNQNSNQKDSILERVLKIMSMVLDQISNKLQNQYSTSSVLYHQLLQKILLFYEKLFSSVKLEAFPGQYTDYFFSKLQYIFQNFPNESQTMNCLIKVLTQIYTRNEDVLPNLIIRTQSLIEQLSIFFQSKSKQLQKSKNTNRFLISILMGTIQCVIAIYAPFKHETQICSKMTVLQILDKNLSQNLLTALYYGLLISSQSLNYWCLKVLGHICDQYQFTDLIVDDLLILNQIFHHSYNSSFSLKKAAISCLCSLIQSLFVDEKAKTDNYIDQQYEILTKNNLIQILTTNLDGYFDLQMNQEILDTIQVLCQFWDLGLENKFWNQFQQQGGKFKLQRIINQKRKTQLVSKAIFILQRFGKKQLQI